MRIGYGNNFEAGGIKLNTDNSIISIKVISKKAQQAHVVS